MPVKPKPKFTKLYFPGLISLACLPLLLITNALWTGKLDKPHGMEVDNFSVENVLRLQKEKLFNLNFNLLHKKAYQLLEVNGSNTDSVIAVLGSTAHKLNIKVDTNRLLKITFTSKAKYKDYVAVSDASYHLDTGLAVLNCRNDVFIWKATPNNYVVNNITPLFIDGIAENEPLSAQEKWQVVLNNLKSLVPLWPSFLLLALMCGLYCSGKGKLQIPVYRSRVRNMY